MEDPEWNCADEGEGPLLADSGPCPAILATVRRGAHARALSRLARECLPMEAERENRAGAVCEHRGLASSPSYTRGTGSDASACSSQYPQEQVGLRVEEEAAREGVADRTRVCAPARESWRVLFGGTVCYLFRKQHPSFSVSRMLFCMITRSVDGGCFVHSSLETLGPLKSRS